MTTDGPSCKETPGRWEGTRTLALVVGAGIALVTAVAGGEGFVASHFATGSEITEVESEIREVKEVQNRLINCVERYAVDLFDIQISQLMDYTSYVNDKANVIANTMDPGGNYSPQFWWIAHLTHENGEKPSVDEIRRKMDENYGAVKALEWISKDLRNVFREHCNQMKLERGQWDVSR